MTRSALVSRLAGLLAACGNPAVAALAFAPVVILAGFLTDQPAGPGKGAEARGGVQASLPAPLGKI